MFGFLINLPVVSYYEIGTNLTTNHAHGAMLFILGGAVPLVWMCVRAVRFPSAKRIPDGGEVPPRLLTESLPPAS